MIRTLCLLMLLFAAPAWAAANPPVAPTTPGGAPGAVPPAPAPTFPRIATAGGVYALPAGVDMPSAKAVHRLLIVARDEQAVAGGVNAQLDAAARVINLYALAGVPPKQIEVAVVVSGKATRLVLTDDSHRRRFGGPNPDAGLLAELHAAGVKVFVCGQALSRQGFGVNEVRDEVRVSLSAITKIEELQAAGYRLVP